MVKKKRKTRRKVKYVYELYDEIMKAITDLRDEDARLTQHIIKLWEYVERVERQSRLPRPPLPHISMFPTNFIRR